jgi:hypothetical protein
MRYTLRLKYYSALPVKRSSKTGVWKQAWKEERRGEAKESGV